MKEVKKKKQLENHLLVDLHCDALEKIGELGVAYYYE